MGNIITESGIWSSVTRRLILPSNFFFSSPPCVYIYVRVYTHLFKVLLIFHGQTLSAYFLTLNNFEVETFFFLFGIERIFFFYFEKKKKCRRKQTTTDWNIFISEINFCCCFFFFFLFEVLSAKKLADPRHGHQRNLHLNK